MLETLNPERIVLLGFGEALCNPNIKEYLEELKKLGTRLVLVSNASFLTEDMSSYLVRLPLDELYVSWDDDIQSASTTIRRGASSGIFRSNLEALTRIKTASGSALPILGMQIVAARSNYQFISRTLAYGRSIGIDRFIVSNLYPYSETMSGEILYDVLVKNIKLLKILRRETKFNQIKIANQNMYVNRSCPFMEKGTVFITAEGDISPCPELAYTHPAFYSGIKRMHNRYILGNINTHTLEEIWNSEAYMEMRGNFHYFEYPDCAYCQHPDLCETRTVKGSDCFGNPTPCGECLWARGVVLCP